MVKWEKQSKKLPYNTAMKLSSKSLDKIKPVLLKRSEELAYTEFRYYGQPNIRYAEKEKIKAKYRPDISTTTMKGNPKGASYNLSLILQNRDKLRLYEAPLGFPFIVVVLISGRYLAFIFSFSAYRILG